MKIQTMVACSFFAALLPLACPCETDTEAQKPPRLAVCNPEVSGIDLSRATIGRLGDRMATRLAASERFRVLPRGRTDARGPVVRSRDLLRTCREQACLVSMMAGRGHLLLLDHGRDFKDYEAAREKVLAHPQVVAATPVVVGEAIASSAASTVAAVVEGTRPGSVGLLSGEDWELAKTRSGPAQHASGENPGLPGVIIGKQMASLLAVEPGDRIHLTPPWQRTKGKDGPAPKARPFLVAGIFSTGMSEWDERLAFLSLDNAQDLFGLEGSVTGLRLLVADLALVEKTAAEACASLGSGPYQGISFVQLNQTLFEALASEQDGKATEADEVLITQVIRTDAACLVTASLFDLESMKAEQSVAVNTSCLEKPLLDAIDVLARELGGV